MERPFVHLNLTRNPFGELDAAERAAVAVVDTSLADGLGPGRAIQVVGPCGHGKTTHLLALAAAIPGATYVRARRDAVPARADVLVLDEADALWVWARWGALRRAGAVVVATHRGLGAELRLAGFRVTTVRARATPDVLHAAFTRRIEHVRRGPGPVPRVDRGRVEALVARYGADVRSMERELYTWVQGLSAPTGPQA